METWKNRRQFFIVQAAVDPQRHSQVDPQLHEDRINYKFMCLLPYRQWKLTVEHAGISAVIVIDTIM